MPRSIDDILDDDLLTVLGRNDEMGSFAIKLGSLETIIYIELGRSKSGDVVKFEVSHAIHTPTQIGPYRTSKPYDDDWEGALWRAVRGLTDYYKEAVNAGHKPAEAWLVQY